MVVAAAVLLVDIIARDTYRFVNQGSALSINALRHGETAKWVGLDDGFPKSGTVPEWPQI